MVVDDLSQRGAERLRSSSAIRRQSVQVVVGDYNALSDDAGVKRFGRASKKMDTMYWRGVAACG